LQQTTPTLLQNVWKIFIIIMAIAISMFTTAAIYQCSTKSIAKSDRASRQRHRAWKASLTVTAVVVNVLLIELLFAYYLIVHYLIVSPYLNIAFGNLLIYLWRILGSPIALTLVVLAFTSIYRHGASKRTKNTPVFPGAILAGVSWAAVSLLFRLYVSHIEYSKIYGAVGTVIILMLWLYLSSLVMLIGEQVNVIIGEAMAESSTT
jgi:membrane protein